MIGFIDCYKYTHQASEITYASNASSNIYTYIYIYNQCTVEIDRDVTTITRKQGCIRSRMIIKIFA